MSKKSNQLLPFLYRVHPKPNLEKLKNLSEFMRALGYQYKIDGKIQSKYLQEILDQVHGTKDAIIVDEVVIRSMAKAFYSTENVGHFGLAFKNYSHFTSPIRRYPDLMVHRLLKQYQQVMDLKKMDELNKHLKKVSEICSDREKNALEAERESVKVKQLEFMKNRIGEKFEGIISGVVHFGIFVEILEYLIEGLVHIRDLDNDFYIFDEKKFALIGESTKKCYRLGDIVNIQLVNVKPEKKEIDFILVN